MKKKTVYSRMKTLFIITGAILIATLLPTASASATTTRRESERNDLRDEGTTNPLHRRAAALGIDITGLTGEEIFEKIRELKPNVGDAIVSINNGIIDFDQPPIIESERLLVPVRAIFEAFGLVVNWFPDEQRIVIYGEEGLYIEMTIDSDIMVVGDTVVKLDVAPKIINGRTLVPLRAISDAIGLEVEWDDIAKVVSVQINPEAVYRRATALGIDINGLTDEEIIEKINEIRLSLKTD